MAATYPTGVKIYVDDEDVTYWVFDADTIDLDDSNFRFSDIDLTPFCSTPGEHKIEITCDSGIGRVEARLEMH